NRRCVYRGRGAPCERGDIYNLTTSFAETTKPALVSCSPNNHCAPLATSSFNNKIARYGTSPQNQNASSYPTNDSDLVALGARLLGRPYNLIGTETPDPNTISRLNQAQVDNVCVPGRTAVGAAG